MPVVKFPITIGTYPIQSVELNLGESVSSASPENSVPENFNESGKDGFVYWELF